jgi:phospholipase/carboxylesterase
MESGPQVIHYKDMVMKVRFPEGEGPHPVLLLLHGWTGDENVMWIFASRLPDNYLMIAPRGLYKSPLGGYGWHEHRRQAWPALDEFKPAVDALVELVGVENGASPAVAHTLEELPGGQDATYQADYSDVSLVGFSQGAALSYAFALHHPQRVRLLAGLAGFMPENAEELIEKRLLEGKQVFVTHGTQDDMVPVEKARRTVELLQRAGSEVTYCEAEAGHKLSAPCFRALEAFFKKHNHRSRGLSSVEEP